MGNVARHGTARHGTARHGTARHGSAHLPARPPACLAGPPRQPPCSLLLALRGSTWWDGRAKSAARTGPDAGSLARCAVRQLMARDRAPDSLLTGSIRFRRSLPRTRGGCRTPLQPRPSRAPTLSVYVGRLLRAARALGAATAGGVPYGVLSPDRICLPKYG